MEVFEMTKTKCTEAWERLKQDVKMIAIERSGKIKYEEKKEEKQLHQLLAILAREEDQTPGMHMNDIKEIKVKLEGLDARKYRGAAIRARSEKSLTGELPTKRAFTDEKRHARKNKILAIEDNGERCREQGQIQKAFVEYYSKVLEYKAPNDEGFKRDFLPLMPKLESEMTERLEN